MPRRLQVYGICLSEMEMNTAQYNLEARAWGKATLEQLRKELQGLGVRRTGLLLRELRVRTGQQYGRVNRVTFSFPRYLVMVEKGAGKGYGGRKGSTWYTGGKKRRTASSSLGKMNTGKRQARPTYNPTMDRRVPVLAELAARFYGDMAINNIRIK